MAAAAAAVVGSEGSGSGGRRRRRRRRGRLGRRRIVYIYIEEMRRVGGRGDIRKPDWWYDECGEGMRRQNEPLPATTTCEADFLPRQGLSREVMGKWLANAAVPWRRRRRLLQTIARMLPCATPLHTTRRRRDDVCARCAKAGKKQVETVAHIQRVQCVSHVEA